MPGQPAGLRRLPVDRLRDLHRKVEPGEDPRSGPLGRDRARPNAASTLIRPGSEPHGIAAADRRRARQRRPAGGSHRRRAAGPGARPRPAAGFAGLDVRAAYLGHAAPSLPQALAAHGPADRAVRAAAAAHRGLPQQDRHPRRAARGARRPPRLDVSYGPHARAAPAAAAARWSGGWPRRAGGTGGDPGRDRRWCWPRRAPATRPRMPRSPGLASQLAGPGAAGGRCCPPTLRPPSRPRPTRWPRCGRPGPGGCWWPATCWHLASSPTGSAGTAWPRARSASPRRSALRPSSPTSCSTGTREALAASSDCGATGLRSPR